MELLLGDIPRWGTYSYWPISRQIVVVGLYGISLHSPVTVTWWTKS